MTKTFCDFCETYIPNLTSYNTWYLPIWEKGVLIREDIEIFDTKGKLTKLIEFQGEQHTQPSNGFYSQTLIEHDKMKVAYCKENKIPLLHLYYKKNYNIKWEDLELYSGVE